MNKVKDAVMILKDIGYIFGDLFKVHLDHIFCLYKETLTNVFVWVLLFLASLLLALIALGFILWGAYIQLAMVTGPGVAGYIVGTFLFLLAIIVFLIGRHKMGR